jgi:hypothetical protein
MRSYCNIYATVYIICYSIYLEYMYSHTGYIYIYSVLYLHKQPYRNGRDFVCIRIFYFRAILYRHNVFNTALPYRGPFHVKLETWNTPSRCMRINWKLMIGLLSWKNRSGTLRADSSCLYRYVRVPKICTIQKN